MTSFIDDDGNELDYDGKDFGLTRQLITPKDFKFKGDFSVNIKLKGTAKNRKILNIWSNQQIGSSAFVPVIFSLIQESELLLRGKIVVLGDDGDEIECFFVSGNTNWIRLFDFKCNEFRSTRWDRIWSIATITDVSSLGNFARRSGIVFPLIDYLFQGQRATNRFINTLVLRTEEDGDIFTDYYPCCFISTIVDEIFRHAGIILDDSEIMADPLYRDVILTPSGNNFIDPVTGESVFYYSGLAGAKTLGTGFLIKPEMIAPEFKAVELLKWIAIVTGSFISFDTESNTLKFRKFDKLDLTNCPDWSDRIKTFDIQYDSVKQHNYINYPDLDGDTSVRAFNKINTTKYASADIQSAKEDGTSRTVYTSPIYPAKDYSSTTKFRWAAPYVPFMSFEDSKEYSYSSVVIGASGEAILTGTGFDLTGHIIRVMDDNGLYDGFWITDTYNSTGVSLDMTSRFFGNSTGKFYTQNVTFNKTPTALLVVDDNSTYEIFTSPSSVVVGSSIETFLPTAYFSKPRPAGYSELDDNHRISLAFDFIDMPGYTDFPIRKLNWNILEKLIVNPPIKCSALLNKSDVLNYESKPIVFVKKEDLSGRFLVERIENFKNSNTECTVYLTSSE